MSHTYESYTMSHTYESYSLSDRDELANLVRSHMVTIYGEKSIGEKLSPYDSQMIRQMVTRNQTVTMKSNGETKFEH